MPRAWSCRSGHGAFLQSGIEAIQREHAWARRNCPDSVAANRRNGAPVTGRLACPVCTSTGGSGFLRPATHDETEALLRQQQQEKAA